MHTLQTPPQAAQWLLEKVTGQLHIDSRQVKQGDGFFAYPGLTQDARQYVVQALSQGASACLVEAKNIEQFPWMQNEIRVGIYTDLKQACGPIADAYFESPSQNLQMLAVTGTNGKTSTAWWLSHALSRTGLRCAVVGTLGMGEAHQLHNTGMTTPDPLQLHAQLRQWVDDGVKACAIEASSIGLSEHRLTGTRLKIAIFTNFTQDHLDYHGNMDAYWQAKSSLFDWPNLQAAVINIDDSQGQALATRLKAAQGKALPDIWTISMHSSARLQAQSVQIGEYGLEFDVVEGDEVHPMTTDVVGEFNVLNLLGVLAAMRALGIALSQAVKACHKLPSIPGRMQSLSGSNKPCVVIDYAHTPDALMQALKALRPMATARKGQLHCIFGCGGDRDTSKRATMAKAAEKGADLLVLTSDNPRSEQPQHIIAQMMDGLVNPAQAIVCIDRAEAIAQAIEKAKPQDVILIAGKGHENYQEIKGLKIPFSDEKQALAALSLWGSA
jgi:UDP-N-acetylmuramoyl-L-alanyl-D-glutamate--2,6-diaminopimelate ligase